jgi:hypothetical protein
VPKEPLVTLSVRFELHKSTANNNRKVARSVAAPTAERPYGNLGSADCCSELQVVRTTCKLVSLPTGQKVNLLVQWAKFRARKL